MRILVIGGTGVVGRHLCSSLLEKEENIVFSTHFSELKEKFCVEGVEYIRLNLDKDVSLLVDFLNQVDVVVFSIQPNRRHFGTIIEALKLSKGNLQKIIYLSSMLVYPDSLIKQKEDVKPEPKTDYEVSKIEEEKLLIDFLRNSDTSLCIVRLGNIYGDFFGRGIVNFIMSSLVSDRVFFINGDGTQVRDYVRVEDAAKFLVGLILGTQMNKVEIYNICTGIGTNILEIIREIENIAKKSLKFEFKEGIKEKQSIVGDNSKLLNFTKLDFDYGLTNGLRKMYDMYLKYVK